MEAVKSTIQESARRQIELVSSTSSEYNAQNIIAGNKKNPIKESSLADQAKKASTEQIKRIAEAMDRYIQSTQCDLNIHVDEKSGRIIVKVISKDSGKVIREIPPKELLDLAAKIEEMTGMFYDKKV